MRAGMSSDRHSAMPRWAKSRHTPVRVSYVSRAEVDTVLVPYS
jgi:hypothetical protein